MKGFTLIEIMIVVAIIALLAAIAIPNLFRARISAQESVAAGALRTIVAAEIQYRANNFQFATLTELGSTTPPYIDLTLGCVNPPCIKQDYKFKVGIPGGGVQPQFLAVAEPVNLSAAHTYFMTDEGILCRSDSLGITIDPGEVPFAFPLQFSGCSIEGFSEAR
ncbi:MAG: prepilin-type N-terminal cleavage/methylation domain-containing protein [Candidatus Omnitrophica bacterium]|nr:prepilin-type N-terminal cleavage/methylation domain-containing protein [Candidatus Omnitrophota bacterium]MDD5238635.1 prepilin-type N-terminal cleavage/methylation domain-containing protein [Candidatus Omnitrophota bacterium]